MTEDIYLGDLPLWSDDEASTLLIETCKKHNVNPDMFKELVQLQRKYQNMERARGIYEDFDYVFERMD